MGSYIRNIRAVSHSEAFGECVASGSPCSRFQRCCFGRCPAPKGRCPPFKGSSTKYFYHMPSPLIDIPAVGQAISTSGQSSSVKKWIKGYAKSKGACVEATIGAYVNATMKVTARATTEKNLETIGSTITSQ